MRRQGAADHDEMRGVFAARYRAASARRRRCARRSARRRPSTPASRGGPTSARSASTRACCASRYGNTCELVAMKRFAGGVQAGNQQHLRPAADGWGLRVRVGRQRCRKERLGKGIVRRHNQQAVDVVGGDNPHVTRGRHDERRRNKPAGRFGAAVGVERGAEIARLLRRDGRTRHREAETRAMRRPRTERHSTKIARPRQLSAKAGCGVEGSKIR